MVDVITIMNSLAVIGLIIPAYFVFKLGNLTGWFKAWGWIAVTFIAAILLRLIIVFQSTFGLPAATLDLIRASVNLLVSIFASIGYISLYKLFKEQKR